MAKIARSDPALALVCVSLAEDAAVSHLSRVLEREP
jgi:hypothetical protein